MGDHGNCPPVPGQAILMARTGNRVAYPWRIAMPGYWLFVTLHVMAGALALGCFWAAAWLRKGSPRHRAVGKVFLLAMTLIVLTSVPITVQFAWYRQQPLS